MDHFKASRPDGRSDTQVVMDLVKDLEPGTLIPYEEFSTALQTGTTRPFPREMIQRIISRSIRRILRETRRTFINIPGQGYRLALASEHSRLATGRERRADRQMKLGYMTLKEVNWDEMGPAERKAHEGHLLITSGLIQAVDALKRRQDRTEKLLRDLLGKDKTITEEDE